MRILDNHDEEWEKARNWPQKHSSTLNCSKYDQKSEYCLGGVSTRRPPLPYGFPAATLAPISANGFLSSSFLPSSPPPRRHCESVGKKTSAKLMMQFSHRQIDRAIDPFLNWPNLPTFCTLRRSAFDLERRLYSDKSPPANPDTNATAKHRK